MRQLVWTAALAVAALLPSDGAHAFCGFYVAKADAKLFNKASKVVLARKGEQTTVTMASDYRGQLSEFALVIPVPVIVGRDQIRVVDNATVDHLDAYTAPRLVEYFDPDPCRPQPVPMVAMSTGTMRVAASAAPAPERARALGVKIEAEYTVGEYDIAILSATQSDGLVTWLNENGYRMPSGAAPVLASYIKQDMKFFVARVNLKEQAKSGASFLRPIQVTYATAKFMLPIRLGTVNADGPQDMIMLMLSERGRIEPTNYRTERIPSNLNVPIYTKTEFATFYRAMFDKVVRRDGQKAIYLEYAWNMGWCDPCAADPVPNDKLAELGVTWIDGAGPPATGSTPTTIVGRPRPGPGAAVPVFITRLHVRYDAQSMPEDLLFQETADTANFQGRYILRHPYAGEATCEAGRAYQRDLATRYAQEAATLAELTGWEIAEIRDRMARSGQKAP